MIDSVTRSCSASTRAAFDGIDGIGQPDVRDAGVGEDFGLAELRAADADGAGLDLPARDLRTLVRLRVRPQPHARVARARLHGGDVVPAARERSMRTRGVGMVARSQALSEVAGPGDGRGSRPADAAEAP